MIAETLTLTTNDLRADLSPGVGGSVARLTWRGHEVLRPAPAGNAHVLDASCFPLVPFANRIAFGRFVWNGRTVQLKPSFVGHPHALHGHGWQNPWRVVSQDPARAHLAFEYRPGDWPWPYRADLEFALMEDGFRAALTLTNLGRGPMPYSLGFHPYFPSRKHIRLTADVSGVWLNDDTQIPTTLVPGDHFFNLSKGADLTHAAFVDNCHTGWNGTARIERPEEGDVITLTASDAMRFLHIFLPEGETYFCAEPVSAMPDAFNRPEPREVTGLRALAPGETASVWMKLRIEPHQ